MADSKQTKSSVWIALLGTVLVLTGGISYPLLLENAWIRSQAIPNIVLVVIGLLLCIWAVVRRRSAWTIAGTALSGLVGVGLLASLFLLMNLPGPSKTWSGGESAPDFTLQNQDGQQVRLSSFRGKGPVLLVFYRGHW